jgi:hypothetical protein
MSCRTKDGKNNLRKNQGAPDQYINGPGFFSSLGTHRQLDCGSMPVCEELTMIRWATLPVVPVDRRAIDEK